jgi:alpha-ketoglutarate-dependent taurine dioxygenase
MEVHYISNLDLATNEVMDGPTSMLSEANHTWHADYSWEPRASRFTALFGVEVTEGGGAQTELASTRRGFETLPPALRARCHGRTVLHRPGGAGTSKRAKPNFAGTDQTAAGLERLAIRAASRSQGTDTVDNKVVETVRRPLLLRGALLLGRHAYRIEGTEEDDTLLNQLTAHCLDRARVYTHKWMVGDVLVWDNECTLHRAVAGVSGTRRHMARTVIAELASPQVSVAEDRTARL